jgi:uncharacterized protein
VLRKSDNITGNLLIQKDIQIFHELIEKGSLSDQSLWKLLGAPLTRLLAHLIYFSIFSTLLPFHALAVDPEPPEYPSSYVIDLAELFCPDTKEQWDALLDELSSKTGDVVIILTVDTIDGEMLRDFSNRMYEKWAPGSRGSNGILFVIVRQLGAWWITTGSEMDGIIPDSMVGTLGRKYITPNLANGRIGDGVTNAIREIVATIARERSVEIDGTPYREGIVVDIRTLIARGLVIIIAGAVVLLAIRKHRQRQSDISSIQKRPKHSGIVIVASLLAMVLLLYGVRVLYAYHRVTQERFITSIAFEPVERLEQWLLSDSWLVTVSPNRQIGRSTPMIAAAASGRIDVMEMLIRHGVDIDSESSEHAIPLEAAIIEGKTEAAHWIALQSRKINHRGLHGQSPLMHAAWKNDGAIIKLLLERGADPMAADINGDTALHTAAEYVTDRQVLDLFFRDCNVDVPNKAGQMPLFIAMKFKNAPLIELLSACKTKGMKGTTKEMSHKQSHGYRVQRGV